MPVTNEVKIQFGVVVADTFGAQAGWKMQSSTIQDKKERANVLDEAGNEVASKLFNEMLDYSAKFACQSNTNTVPTTIGKLVGNGILTSISIGTNNKSAATMNLAGHQHVGLTHADTLQQALHAITVPKFFGAIDFMGGTGATGAALVSGNITIACQHQDIEDGDGAHLVGENYNCMITATSVWSGTVSVPAVAGWDVTVVETPTGNTGFIQTTVTGIKKLALAAPV